MLISLLVALIVIALIYWIITQLPLPPLVQQIATIILVVFVVVWLISVLQGGSTSLFTLHS